MPRSPQVRKLGSRFSFSPRLPRLDKAPPGLSAPNRPRLRGFAAARCVGGPRAAKPPSLLPIIHARLLHAGITGTRVALH